MKPHATLDRFAEAEAWFRSRVKLNAFQAKAMADRARKQGAKAAALAQLRAADKVMAELERAVKEGLSLDQVREALRAKLKVLPDDANLETAFRDNVQLAYSAGRQRQMMEPEVLALRPLWLFDPILDGRTTEICRSCKGVLLPASHPWWATHRPPLHHRCRSTIRNLSEAAGLALGVTRRPPKDEPDAGWGNPLVEDFTPDLSKVHPLLLAAFKKRA